MKDAERLEFSESDQVLFESLEDLKREYKLVSEFYEEVLKFKGEWFSG